MSYWHRLENTNTELLSDAFACLQTLHENGFHSWFSSIHNILSLLEITSANHQLNNLNFDMFKKSIRSTLLMKYKEFWDQFRINNIDGKLRTYFTFKDHFQTKQYLSTIKNFDKRRCLTKFRISSHKLKIELGRFSRPITPLQNRVCDHCLTIIEDEFHFLMQCPMYSHLQKNFFSIVQKQCKNFSSHNSKIQFNWLLANSDDFVILQLADYVFDCFEIHSK